VLIVNGYLEMALIVLNVDLVNILEYHESSIDAATANAERYIPVTTSDSYEAEQ
jgi:hypothetical protein